MASVRPAADVVGRASPATQPGRRSPSGAKAAAGRTSAPCLGVSVAIFASRYAVAGRRALSLLPMKADKIYLVGFMGAGKTTLARALAKRLGWRAVDIDELIEAREHESVSGIFARHGEAYFRAAERAVLAAQLEPRHVVVATGGGTFSDVQNRAAINRDGASVWLDVPLDRLIDRIPADGRRPLAADRAALERLYYQRRGFYEQAHLRLDASRASVDALVEQLTDWLEH